ncbi:MAG: hypothetical protein NXI24_14220 [bacterium]|nr:hypothetical protein [bacterium]
MPDDRDKDRARNRDRDREARDPDEDDFFADDGPDESERESRRSGGASGSKSDLDSESVVRKYYALFENLVVMLLDWRNWSRSLRSFLKVEARYRARLLITAIGLFVAGMTCIVVAIWLLALGFYQLLAWAFGSPMLASFALFLGFLLLAVFLFAILLKTGGKLLEQREPEDDLYSDDDSY